MPTPPRLAIWPIPNPSIGSSSKFALPAYTRDAGPESRVVILHMLIRAESMPGERPAMQVSLFWQDQRRVSVPRALLCGTRDYRPAFRGHHPRLGRYCNAHDPGIDYAVPGGVDDGLCGGTRA